MINRLIAALCLISVLSCHTFSQTSQAGDEPVVRVTTKLVQIDAVVIDEEGNYVTDLTADDFEILEDKRPQKIANFSFISTRTAAAPPRVVTSGDFPINSRPLKPEEVRRVFTLIVDSLFLSYESAYRLQVALKKFIDEQVQPGDLVAILRTGGDVGSVQQFTSDKRLLYAAIEKLRPNGSPIAQSLATISISQDYRRAARKKSFTVGTLGALSTIVQGLRNVPGRKAAVIFSDGFTSFDRATQEVSDSKDVQNAVRLLADQANRASLVVYTVDTQGLTVGNQPGFAVAPDPFAIPAPIIFGAPGDDGNLTTADISPIFVSRFLTQQTGGLSIFNNNDLQGSIERIVADQQGYYLLGYVPDDEIFQDKRKGERDFFKVTVKVKRPGLRVRSRRGFYGATDEETNPLPSKPIDRLNAAIISPFTTNTLPLHMSTLFLSPEPNKRLILALINVDASKLTFVEEKDGWRKAEYDVFAVTFGDNGLVKEKLLKTQHLRVRGKTYERILKEGFISRIDFPVKKPGAYQFRIAIRDTVSQNIGSASQFIEIPESHKEKLSLSSILLANGMLFEGVKKLDGISTFMPAQAGMIDPINKNQLETYTLLRTFARGAELPYSFQIYLGERVTAQLETQVRIFRNGQLVYTGAPQPLTSAQSLALPKATINGSVKLSHEFQPGDYDLVVTVTNRLDKTITVSQSVDFRIVD